MSLSPFRSLLRAALCVLLLVGAPAGCAADAEPVAASADPCAAPTRSYDELVAGAELCDTQTLLAALSSTRVDEQAGQGALRVPFRVTASEKRRYCFNDDNGERHKLVITAADGATVLSLVAGDPCQELSLPAGSYVVRFEHARIGVVDPTGDLIHTRLVPGDDVSTFVFDVNSCPSCNLSGARWPCHDPPAGSGPRKYCGFTGRYVNANFQNTRCAGDGKVPAPIECFLAGTFDGAFFTGGSVMTDPLADRLVFGPSSDVAPTDDFASSFAGTVFAGNFYDGSACPSCPRLILRHVDKLTGTPMSLARFVVENESENLEVNDYFRTQLNLAPGFSGARARQLITDAKPDFSNLVLDFARVELVAPIVNGKRSLVDANFQNATLRNVRAIRSGDEPYSLANANFRGATVSTSIFDATVLSGADFTGATLDDVQFLDTPGGRTDASKLKLDNAKLTKVSFGSVTDDGVSRAGANLSGMTATKATVSTFYARNSVLSGSVWDGASINGLTASNANLSGAQLRELSTFDRVDFSYSLLQPLKDSTPDAKSPPIPFRLSVGGDAPFSRFKLVGATLDVDFAGQRFMLTNMSEATLAGTFDHAVFEDSSLRNAILTSSTSFDGVRFTNTPLDGASIACAFENVVSMASSFTSASFVGSSARNTAFHGGSLASAHFCSGGFYGGMEFDHVDMTGLVMPLVGEVYPPLIQALKPGEVRCTGSISASERDALITQPANFCPNGESPGLAGCRGGQWTPLPSKVTPSCCAASPTCKKLAPKSSCQGDCECASGTCGPDATCH